MSTVEKKIETLADFWDKMADFSKIYNGWKGYMNKLLLGPVSPLPDKCRIGYPPLNLTDRVWRICQKSCK